MQYWQGSSSVGLPEQRQCKKLRSGSTLYASSLDYCRVCRVELGAGLTFLFLFAFFGGGLASGWSCPSKDASQATLNSSSCLLLLPNFSQAFATPEIYSSGTSTVMEHCLEVNTNFYLSLLPKILLCARTAHGFKKSGRGIAGLMLTSSEAKAIKISKASSCLLIDRITASTSCVGKSIYYTP
jgi:hypothetical protein